MTYVVIDFETYSCADLNKVGAWRYAEDVSTGILCLGYKVVTDGQAARTVVIDEAAIKAKRDSLYQLALDNKVIFVAHNAQFEQAIWKHIMVAQFGWPELPPERWHDTMAVAARKTLPMSLDKVGQVLNLNTRKDMEGHRLMMQMCKPRPDGNFDHSPEKVERLKQYNVGDVDTQYELHLRLGGLGASERRIWIHDQRVNQRGIMVDVPYVRQCMALLEKAREPLEKEFRAATGFSPTQRAKILEWVKEQGVPLPDMRKATLDAILDPENEIDGIDDLPPHVLRVIEIRRMLASSSVAKLGRMIETANLDGRVRGTSQYHGARTGRNAGRLVQPLNMPRPLFDPDEIPQRQIMDDIRAGDLDIINERYGNAYDAVISTLRGCFKPGAGRVFAAGDFNAIEARIVTALAGDYKAAESFNAKKNSPDDPYVIAGRKVGKDRAMGKAILLGSGFQMSAAKFHLVAAPKESMELAQACIDYYRKDFAPLVPKLWYGLDKASTDAVWCNSKKRYEYRGISYQMRDAYLVCTLPSGREIYYYQPQREQKVAPWDENEILPAWSFMSFQGKQARRKTMFGGLACLAAETEVLTVRGFVPIVDVTTDDLVWDGQEWVSHDGCEYMGQREVIDFGGVRLTPDHKIWVGEWVEAQDCNFDRAFAVYQALGRSPERPVNRGTVSGRQRLRGQPMGSPMHLRGHANGIAARLRSWGREILRRRNLQFAGGAEALAGYAWHDETSSVCGVEVDARPLSTADTPSLAQLWRSRDFGMRAMANLRGFLGRYGRWLGQGSEHRAHQQRRKLLSGELPVDSPRASSEEPSRNAYRANSRRADGGARRGQEVWRQSDDSLLADKQRVAAGAPVRVYDLINAGPRNRFTIRAPDGRCIIVSNCENVVQATARDIMVEAMFRAEAAGLPMVFTVYDELVTEPLATLADADKLLQQCMEERSDWVKEFAIPIRAECEVLECYQK